MPVLDVAPFRPDNAHLNSAYATEIWNVLRAESSYIPFKALQAFTAQVGAVPLGGITIRDDDGLTHIFCGTAGKLWKLDNTTLTWEDVSKAATTYSATIDERWRFKYYKPYVVAVNINDDPQYYQIGTSTDFANLPGTPPRMRQIAVTGDRMSGVDDDTMYWCDTDDISNWTTGTSGSQKFPDGGKLMGLTDATNPLIFQKAKIRLGTFVPGSLETFSFQTLHDQRGAAAPYSICTRGAVTFFADSGAFFMISSDGQISPIGFEKVDRTIFGQISGVGLTRIFGEIDPFYSRVYFAIQVESTTDAFDRLLCYDWQIGEWTQIRMSLNILFPLASGTIGYTLAGLDTISATLAGLPFPLGSKVWQGGAPVMAAFDSNGALGFFQGANAEATIVTQELGDPSAGVTRFNEVVPIVDVDDFSDLRLSVGSRMRRTDTINWTSEFTPSTNTGIGRKNVRSRFNRIKTVISAGANWTHCQGCSINSSSAGLR